MVSNIFYFSICWEQLSQLTNIVQRGWNHQPVIVSPQFSYSPSLVRRGCPNVPIAEDSTDGLSPTNQPGYNISRARQGWYPDARSSLLQGVAQHEDPIRSILPSGKHTKSYRKSPFLMGKSTISMAISNSYVKLPEGNLYICIFTIHWRCKGFSSVVWQPMANTIYCHPSLAKFVRLLCWVYHMI